MMGIGFPELMIILVIIMIIFGAGKLPEIGSAFGRSIKNFKKSMKDMDRSALTTTQKFKKYAAKGMIGSLKAVRVAASLLSKIPKMPHSSFNRSI